MHVLSNVKISYIKPTLGVFFLLEMEIHHVRFKQGEKGMESIWQHLNESWIWRCVCLCGSHTLHSLESIKYLTDTKGELLDSATWMRSKSEKDLDLFRRKKNVFPPPYFMCVSLSFFRMTRRKKRRKRDANVLVVDDDGRSLRGKRKG